MPPTACQRKNLLPRDARHGHCALADFYKQGLRLEHPEAAAMAALLWRHDRPVSGAWVLGRPPQESPASLLHHGGQRGRRH